MKALCLLLLLILPGLVGMAQTRDTTTAKSGRVIYNPNAQRNGYETYQNSATLSGVGLNPGATINTIDHRYEGLRGTPYFLPEWTKGQIEMTAGQNYTNVPLKFNAYQQHLVLLRTWAGNDSIIVDANQVKRFTLTNTDGQTYLFKRLPTAKTNDEMLKNSYFLVLYEGKNTLLKRVAKAFKQADYKDPYSKNVRYDEFKLVSSYYLLKPDQTLTKVKLSDKALIEALGDRKEELKAFVDQKNLNVRSEDDAVTLVKQYDSL